MMDRTDRHYRYFMRCLTRHTLLYTEMVTTGAVLRGDRDRLLGFDPVEAPIALQLGGDDPDELAQCARIAVDWGYDEVNLNVGCPSDRVQKGRFGACLMAEPERVAAAVDAMRNAVDVPVTVKHRIGIDEIDRYEDMLRFVDVVSAAGADRFSVHARKAWLQGLSPKENREIPPLRYEEVHRLKRERPGQVIEINGGIVDLDQTAHHLQHVDAVMIGRAAYENPYLFAEVDRRFFDPEAPVASKREVIEAMKIYAARHLESGTRLGYITRHMTQLCHRHAGARGWRRHLSERGHRPGAGVEVLHGAMARVPDAILDHRGAGLPASAASPAVGPVLDTVRSESAALT